MVSAARTQHMVRRIPSLQAKSAVSQSYPIVLGWSIVAKVTLAQLQSKVLKPLHLVKPSYSLLNKGHYSVQGHRKIVLDMVIVT